MCVCGVYSCGCTGTNYAFSAVQLCFYVFFAVSTLPACVSLPSMSAACSLNFVLKFKKTVFPSFYVVFSYFGSFCLFVSYIPVVVRVRISLSLVSASVFMSFSRSEPAPHASFWVLYSLVARLKHVKFSVFFKYYRLIFLVFFQGCVLILLLRVQPASSLLLSFLRALHYFPCFRPVSSSRSVSFSKGPSSHPLPIVYSYK